MSRRDVLEQFIAQEETTRRRVDEGVEKYRKGDFCVAFTDEAGKPIVGETVKFTQKTHDFRYGANLFLLDELETPEKNEAYKKFFAECFNMATLPFYWQDIEPQKGKKRFAADSPKIYRRPAIDLCMDYCQKRHRAERTRHLL